MSKSLSNSAKTAFKLQIGMAWDCFGALGVDSFKIIDIQDNETVTIIEDGYPCGPRIETVEWSAYYKGIRERMPLYRHIKYLGVKGVSDEQIANVKYWQEMMDQTRLLDF